MILLVFAAHASAADAPGPAAATAPRISFEAKEIDFGKIVTGGVVERTYKFRNVGGSSLVIRRVKPSCGCTAALTSKAELKPGEQGEIQARFETGDRQGFQTIEIHVFTNDGAENDMGENVSVLRLRGEITNLLSAIPASFYYQQVLRGGGVERRVSVLPNDVAEVKALSVEVSKPWLRASLAPFARPGRKGFEVVLTLAADAPIGQVEERVTVKTDHPQQPVLRIPVMGVVHGKITCFPPKLLVGGREGEKEQLTVFLMRMAGEGPIPIEAVEAPAALFTAEANDIIPGKRAEVVLKLKPDAPRGPFAGVVRIFLRDPEQPVFEVPILGEVPRRVTVDPPGAWLEGADAEVLLRVGGAAKVAVSNEGAPVLFQVRDGGIVALRLKPDAKPGPFQGKITLKTDVPGEETIDVPVRGIVPPR